MEALTYRSTTGLITTRRDVPRLTALARVLADAPELRDAYDALLGSLRLSATFNAGNAILVTSTQPDEGKTTVAACLAITASLAGYSVLLVDGDLRRPWLAAPAGGGDAVGLGEVLEGVAEATEVMDLVDLLAEAGPIRVMAAGRRSPAFLPAVDWPKARATFQAAARPFGLVLLDSPPLMAASDALLLAGIADGVLLVVGAGSAHRDEVRRAKEQIGQTGTPFIGAVLNQLDPKASGRPGYRSYYRSTRP